MNRQRSINISEFKTPELIGLMDTSIASENTGDCIIMDSINPVLEEIFSRVNYIRFPTHEKISLTSWKIQSRIIFNIVCGTNLLHAHMGIIKQWNIGLISAFNMAPSVLLGVGWRSQKKRKTDKYTRFLLRKILSMQHLHSVRDSYAKERLDALGFKNILNTGCPSIWGLNEDHCAKIPNKKGENAIMVLTDYSKNTDLDKQLIDCVLASYKNVFLWFQGTKDYNYANDLGILDRVTVINSNLRSYDRILEDTSLSLDYIGTRLHGGIRALQKSRRSIIIGVDHRANIMGKDFSLPVLNRYEDFNKIKNTINNPFSTNVKLAREDIQRWKSQFNC